MICDRKAVALCTSRIYDPQTHLFIEKINESFRRREVSLFIYTINYDFYWNENEKTDEAYVYDLIPYDKMDLVILMDEKIKSHRISEKIISASKEHSVPVIVIDGHYDGTISVCFDYETGFEAIVRHVIEDHGVRRPHMMAGIEGNVFSDRRIDVFKKVLSENGIPFTDDMISYGEFWAIPARKVTQALIDSGDLPEALICANDIMAINACSVFRENGILVPDQILVTGFDGYDEVKFSRPPISTVNCKTDVLAEAVAAASYDIFDRKDIPDNIPVIPRAEYNLSCGCHPDKSFDQSEALIDRFNDHYYRYQDDMKRFHGMTEKMQAVGRREEVTQHMRDMDLRFMYCIVSKECLCRDRNVFQEDDYDFMSGEMCVLYDYFDSDREFSDIDPGEIIPDLGDRLESGMPLIFNILSFMDKPVGYICWILPDYEITDYSKTSSVSSTVAIGIGGYINMQYQRYLSEKVSEMYRKDLLTGLYNRIAFTHRFEEIRRISENTGKPVHIIMADLDGLKYINDNFGHDAGDSAIAVTAKALRASCPDKALCLRYGGDEMLAVILGDCDGKAVMRRIDDFLTEYNAASGLPYKVVASCGIFSTTLTPDFNFEDAVRNADKSMYAQKNEHKRGLP